MTAEGADHRLLRLQKLIAHSGLTSRRGAEELIKAGRVTVDGKPAHLGQKIDPGAARVEVDGIPLPVRPGLVYLLVNKPAGVVSTVRDPQGRTTVIDLVDHPSRLYPVGRLDADSEGLVLLTNDGELANRVMHPRYGVTKEYVVWCTGVPSRQALRALVDGVELDDGRARARAARTRETHGDRALVEVVMGEGRKREVRRMFEAIGHPVVRLVRTRIGPVADPGLRPGEWRQLTVEEVRALYGEGAGRE